MKLPFVILLAFASLAFGQANLITPKVNKTTGQIRGVTSALFRTGNGIASSSSLRVVHSTVDVGRTVAGASNDPDLTIAVAANETLFFEAWVPVDSGSATPDLVIRMSCPASPSLMTYSIVSHDFDTGTVTAPHFEQTTGTPTAVTIALSGMGKVMVHMVGTLINGGGAGNLAVSWGQNTADATATSRLKGAFLKAMLPP